MRERPLPAKREQNRKKANAPRMNADPSDPNPRPSAPIRGVFYFAMQISTLQSSG
jgi:hypothetical protein